MKDDDVAAGGGETGWVDRAFARWPWPMSAVFVGYSVAVGLAFFGVRFGLVHRDERITESIAAGVASAGAVLALWGVVKCWNTTRWLLLAAGVICALVYNWQVVVFGGIALFVLNAVIEWGMRVERQQRQILNELKVLRADIEALSRN